MLRKGSCSSKPQSQYKQKNACTVCGCGFKWIDSNIFVYAFWIVFRCITTVFPFEHAQGTRAHTHTNQTCGNRTLTIFRVVLACFVVICFCVTFDLSTGEINNNYSVERALERLTADKLLNRVSMRLGMFKAFFFKFCLVLVFFLALAEVLAANYIFIATCRQFVENGSFDW